MKLTFFIGVPPSVFRASPSSQSLFSVEFLSRLKKVSKCFFLPSAFVVSSWSRKLMTASQPGRKRLVFGFYFLSTMVRFLLPTLAFGLLNKLFLMSKACKTHNLKTNIWSFKTAETKFFKTLANHRISDHAI